MARLRGSLFGSPSPAVVHRYAILRKLGMGGHGVVYAAWDPRLDRKVAIKVLHPGAPPILEQEARALARLAHPNIVTLHDVGESQGQLFFAMEFVDGTPLDAVRASERGWRAVVAMYRQVARGLAAAHAAGLVHRDFKPANAILGHDGRVRVLDFGLARADVANAATTRVGGGSSGVIGTPRYMAPEQHRGETADAQTDQYCYCASLWEALCGRPPFEAQRLDALYDKKMNTAPMRVESSAPAPIFRALERGLSPVPRDRFASMEALESALAFDPRARWRAPGLVGALGLAVGAGVWAGDQGIDCAEAGASAREVWSDVRADELGKAFAATGLPYAAQTWSTTRQELDGWIQRWGEAHVDACRAHARGEQSALALDQRFACLDLQRRHFEALLGVFAVADVQAVDRAVLAAGSLPSVQPCADLASLGRTHPIAPEHRDAVERGRALVAEARAQLEAGHYAEAKSRAARVKADAPYPPLRIEAEVVHGEALGYLGEHDAALVALHDAAVAAQRERLPALFGRAAAGLLWEVGEVDAEFEQAMIWADLAAASLDSVSGHLNVRMSLLNNRAVVLATAGRWDEAVAAHERRLAMLQAERGADTPLSMFTYANLANLENLRGRTAQAEAAYAQAIDIGALAFGAAHPRVLTSRQNRAGMRIRAGDPRGISELREILELQRDALGTEHPDLAATLVNLSLGEYKLSAFADALEHAVVARQILVRAYGPQSHLTIDARLAESDALAALHRTARATAVSGQAVEIAVSTLGGGHVSTAYARRSWGDLLMRTGALRQGREQLRLASASFTTLGMEAEARRTDDYLASSSPTEGL